MRLTGKPSSRRRSASQCELESSVKPPTSSSPMATMLEAGMRAPYNLSRVERLHGVIRGDVQGVGFRYFLVREAHVLGHNSGSLIEVQGLTKFYDERPAIQDVTFSVPKGQVLGFLGPNGAGKSTTMRILAGFLGLSVGNASVDGYDVFSHSLDVRKRIGYLPETTPLYNEM